MSGYRCLHLPHNASIDVFQPTALIVFGLKISISLLAEVMEEQGLMQGSGASTVSAAQDSANIKLHTVAAVNVAVRIQYVYLSMQQLSEL